MNPMNRTLRRSIRIIAALALSSLGSTVHADDALGSDPIAGYASYHVRLEVVRNRVYMGAPEQLLSAGEPASAELDPGSPRGALRIQQRVTRFPGAGRTMALLELEFFGLDGGEPQRLVAPTLGVELGVAQTYELRTPQGLINVRATVDGLDPVHEEAGSQPLTIPYPTI